MMKSLMSEQLAKQSKQLCSVKQDIGGLKLDMKQDMGNMQGSLKKDFTEKGRTIQCQTRKPDRKSETGSIRKTKGTV
jgi:hypothetical protein